MQIPTFYSVKRYNSTTQQWIVKYRGTDAFKAAEIYADYTKFAKPQEKPMVRFYEGRELVGEF